MATEGQDYMVIRSSERGNLGGTWEGKYHCDDANLNRIAQRIADITQCHVLWDGDMINPYWYVDTSGSEETRTDLNEFIPQSTGENFDNSDGWKSPQVEQVTVDVLAALLGANKDHPVFQDRGREGVLNSSVPLYRHPIGSVPITWDREEMQWTAQHLTSITGRKVMWDEDRGLLYGAVMPQDLEPVDMDDPRWYRPKCNLSGSSILAKLRRIYGKAQDCATRAFSTSL
jgi:hypothetical protein